MTTSIVPSATTGAASCPRKTPVEKVQATASRPTFAGIDLIERAIAPPRVVAPGHRPVALVLRRGGDRGEGGSNAERGRARKQTSQRAAGARYPPEAVPRHTRGAAEEHRAGGGGFHGGCGG